MKKKTEQVNGKGDKSRVTNKKKFDKNSSEVNSVKNRLTNKDFITKAPKEVVEELKNKLEKLEFDQEKIEEQIRMLSSN